MMDYSDMPRLVQATSGGFGGGGGGDRFPPEAIRPGGFGAGTPSRRQSRLPSGSRFTTPAAGFSNLAPHDDAGFAYQPYDYGSAPPAAPQNPIFKYNPWLAEKFGAGSRVAGGFGRRQPHPGGMGMDMGMGTPYQQPQAALSMGDADWPRHGHDFGFGGQTFDMGGGGAPPEAGFGDGGFGEHHDFVGGFGRPPSTADEGAPVIPPRPDMGLGRSRSAHGHGHARSKSHSPGFGATTFDFDDFGHAPPPPQGGFGHTPQSSSLTLTPGWGDTWRRNNSSAGSTPQTSAMPLNAHHGYASGPRNQYKKPNDWRSDFAMPRKVGLGEKLGLNRVLSVGKVFQGEAKNAPHRTLDGSNAAVPACMWDVRLLPNSLRLPSGPPLSYLELQEAAFSMPPKNGRIVLVHELLPWSLTLTAGATAYGTATVVTVGHLVQTIHAELHRQIFESDFWNEAVGEGDRARIHKAWSTRCSVLADVAAGEEQSMEREAKCREFAAEGVKRVDFLGDRTLFYGLKRKAVTGGEVWEMRFRKIEG